MVSFLVRPIGAVIFGHIGDTIGRKKTLILTILLISFATCGIGLLPNAEHIGIYAPNIACGIQDYSRLVFFR